MQKLIGTALAAGLAAGSAAAQAGYLEEGNWAAVRMGKTCYVFTRNADPNTSGMLRFSFQEQGFNAGFDYEYHPWPGEDSAPWDETADFVQLYVDDQPVWMGEEMFFVTSGGGYGAAMTGGIVSEMAAAVKGAKQSIGFAVERETKGETWLYGGFATTGFAAALAHAGTMCQFDPDALPSS